VNLGYRAQGVSRVRIGLEGPGTTRFGSLRVLALPMTDYATRVSKLQATAMRDISIGTNTVSGRVSTTRNGVLFLSIPYSEGWSAEVDTVPARVVRVNTAFTGVVVGPGDHVVTLHYLTPWLQPGLALAAASLVLALAAAGWRIRARRHPAARAARPEGAPVAG
jgi:uncharacterized membrane protein YfhO